VTNFFGDFSWLDNLDGLVSRLVPGNQTNIGAGHAETLRQEFHQSQIGRSVHRGAADPDLEAISYLADETIAPTAGLNQQLTDEDISPPAARPVMGQRRTPGKGIAIIKAWRPMMTKRGERSRPAMGGMMRRTGRSRGSDILARTLVSGL
jgi:hypothetical protein